MNIAAAGRVFEGETTMTDKKNTDQQRSSNAGPLKPQSLKTRRTAKPA